MSRLDQRDAYFLSLLQYDGNEKVAKRTAASDVAALLGSSGKKKYLGTKSEGFFKDFVNSLSGAPNKALKASARLSKAEKQLRKGVSDIKSSGGTVPADWARTLRETKKAGKRARKAVRDARIRTAMGYGALGVGGLGLAGAGAGAYNLATNG